MKKTMTALLIAAPLWMLATTAGAETQDNALEKTKTAAQFLGQRAYAAPVQTARADAQEAWVGATLVVDSMAANPVAGQQKLHMLGKRAF